jgi:hypothetical protein
MAAKACKANEQTTRTYYRLGTVRHGRAEKSTTWLVSVGVVQPVASGPLARWAHVHPAMLRVLRLPRIVFQGLELGVNELLARNCIWWRHSNICRIGLKPMWSFAQHARIYARSALPHAILGNIYRPRQEYHRMKRAVACIIVDSRHVDTQSPCIREGTSGKASDMVSLVMYLRPANIAALVEMALVL